MHAVGTEDGGCGGTGFPNRGAKENVPTTRTSSYQGASWTYVPPYQRGQYLKILAITDVRKYFAAVVDSVIDDAEECRHPPRRRQSGGHRVTDEWVRGERTLHVLGRRPMPVACLESIAQVTPACAGLTPARDPGGPTPASTGKPREPTHRLYPHAWQEYDAWLRHD